MTQFVLYIALDKFLDRFVLPQALVLTQVYIESTQHHVDIRVITCGIAHVVNIYDAMKYNSNHGTSYDY